jgi:hypothetical protein
LKSIVADIPKRVFDNSAETLAELQQSTARSYRWLARFANTQVKAGVWERVWKMVPRGVGKYPAAAYRRKK